MLEFWEWSVHGKLSSSLHLSHFFHSPLFIALLLLLSVLFLFILCSSNCGGMTRPHTANSLCLRHVRTCTHLQTHTHTHTSHLDLCLILCQSPDRKHLSRWNPASKRNRARERRRKEEWKKKRARKKNRWREKRKTLIHLLWKCV